MADVHSRSHYNVTDLRPYVRELEESQEDREDIPCPVCDSRHLTPLYEGVALRGNTLVLVACRDCSHFFITPRPNLKIFNKFYADANYFHLCAEFYNMSLEEKMAQFDDDDDFWAKRFVHGRRLHDTYLSEVLKPGDTVFDFGCGDGAWLGALREVAGCEIDGEEISPIYGEIVKRKFGVDIFVGPAEELIDDIVEKHRDNVKVVIVSGSLQHMLDPMACLRAAHEMLTNDGRLYICNWSIFEHVMASYNGSDRRLVGEIISWEHLHYFHETSFKFMAEKAGFEILNFALESKIRPQHMEILASKSSAPASLPADDDVENAIDRVRAFESATIANRLRIR